LEVHAVKGRVAGVLPAGRASATRLEAHAFNLSAVRLVADAGNHFAAAQQLNTQFLANLDPDRFLVAWRMVAQLQPYGLNGAVPYGGWMELGPHQHTDMGHFSGHYLSATAFTAAATDELLIRRKSAYLVNEIANCQDAICAANASMCGYVGAFPIAELEQLENHHHYDGSSHVIPYYAIHKVMAGLLDTYEQTDNAQAFSVLLKMASFFKKRIDNIITAKGIGWWEACLLLEFGGMNEVAYNLYAITGNEEHRQLGDLFYKAVFMDPIARGDEDALTNYHANTHLAQLIGVARGWETTGNATLQYITTESMRILTAHFTYAATGGSSQDEHWRYPDQLGTAVATSPGHDSPGYHTEESCTQYNALKMVRHLFRWNPSAALADDYEAKVNNGVIGIQEPNTVGSMIYMTPLGDGVSRPLANWHQENGGWGSENASFWCCYGTAIESFGKLGDSIYFHSGATSSGAGLTPQRPRLWVVQYISSTLNDELHGLNLTQRVSNVRASSGHQNNALQTTITIRQLSAAPITADLTVSLRIPSWADAAATTVSLNGQPVVEPGTCQVGTFLHVKQPRWTSGDVLAASFGMRPRFIKLNDDRDAYDTFGSLHYGPHLLVGLTSDYVVQADAAQIDQWLTLDAASHSGAAAHELSFTAKRTAAAGGGFKLLPLNRVVDQVYTAHFNVSTHASQGRGRSELPELPPRSVGHADSVFA
jgi:DUF1680 family protein